ncbi:MAG: SUMF1/EgtB/PvdO family nonheme iron enzyme [Chitinophagales bacterium]|nr:SUMF1/EgtB/PvdO family nonheme iron enzyme [Chitinophagales bacterium]
MKRNITLIVCLLCFGQMLDAQPLPEMIKVEDGTFKMGDRTNFKEWEKPIHEVTVESFYMGETEVTVEQYFAYCNGKDIETPFQPTDWSGWKRSERSVVNVSWLDVQGCLKWIIDNTGMKM